MCSIRKKQRTTAARHVGINSKGLRMDKFAEYFKNQNRMQELSEYVHKNFHLIATKMISEMRRKLDIKPDLKNSEGYISLMVTLYGRMFNELVYSLCGICQTFNLELKDILPTDTIRIFKNLLEGKNELNGLLRKDVNPNKHEKEEYYLQHIDFIRKVEEALPEYHFGEKL